MTSEPDEELAGQLQELLDATEGWDDLPEDEVDQFVGAHGNASDDTEVPVVDEDESRQEEL